MKKTINAKVIVIGIWTLYLMVFLFDFNFFPFLKFDLYSRVSEFNLKKSVFLARPKGEMNFSEDISSQFAFSIPWKFSVTLRIIQREHPDKINQILKDRLQEINLQTNNRYSGIRFISILDNVETQVAQVEIE